MVTLLKLYWKLYHHFGPQHWWPAETPFEVIVGAILTQNTAWANVEQAIVSLKNEGLLDAEQLLVLSSSKLENLIRPAGYFRQKSQRLKAISRVIVEDFHGDLANLFSQPLQKVRGTLLAVNGLGPETADSILLYAGEKPVFVIDAYTKRISRRLDLTDNEKYQNLQRLFERNLPLDVRLYQEFHALLVALAKNNCRKIPQCEPCPLGGDCADRLLA